MIQIGDLLQSRFGVPDVLHGAKCDRCRSDCVMIDLLPGNPKTPKIKSKEPAMYKLEAIARCPQLAVIHVDRVTVNPYTGYM